MRNCWTSRPFSLCLTAAPQVVFTKNKQLAKRSWSRGFSHMDVDQKLRLVFTQQVKVCSPSTSEALGSLSSQHVLKI